MKNISTPCMDKLKQQTDKNLRERHCAPCKQTLDFLTQFARVYQAEPALKSELCGYVLN